MHYYYYCYYYRQLVLNKSRAERWPCVGKLGILSISKGRLQTMYVMSAHLSNENHFGRDSMGWYISFIRFSFLNEIKVIQISQSLKSITSIKYDLPENAKREILTSKYLFSWIPYPKNCGWASVDGLHILLMSLGNNKRDYFRWAIAIESFSLLLSTLVFVLKLQAL